MLISLIKERRHPMKLTRNVGTLLLAVWLIMQGLMAILDLSFHGSGTILALLALAAGVLILLDR
jgi:hypothetical protein